MSNSFWKIATIICINDKKIVRQKKKKKLFISNFFYHKKLHKSQKYAKIQILLYMLQNTNILQIQILHIKNTNILVSNVLGKGFSLKYFIDFCKLKSGVGFIFLRFILCFHPTAIDTCCESGIANSVIVF